MAIIYPEVDLNKWMVEYWSLNSPESCHFSWVIFHGLYFMANSWFLYGSILELEGTNRIQEESDG